MDSKEPRKLKEDFLVKKVRMLPNKSYQTPLTKKKTKTKQRNKKITLIGMSVNAIRYF